MPDEFGGIRKVPVNAGLMRCEGLFEPWEKVYWWRILKFALEKYASFTMGSLWLCGLFWYDYQNKDMEEMMNKKIGSAEQPCSAQRVVVTDLLSIVDLRGGI